MSARHTDEEYLSRGLLTPPQITRIRENLGLTQADMARLLRIAHESLNRFEHGVLIQRPVIDQLLRVLQVPGVYERLRETQEI